MARNSSRSNSIQYQAGRNGRAASRAAYAYYADGNTVRKTEVQVQRRAVQHENAHRSTRSLSNVRRAERSELSIDLPFLLLLTAAIAATLVICYNYLRLTASIDAHMDNIERLETTLENMRTENDALEQSIDTSVDLNYVYNIAVNELGMIHAGKDNTITYDKTESEYVRQYENIPKN
ncbi:MAG: cell division protein FtsL [Eubacteriales bacterium]|nr:cell division protein FtsL [Eubacteriales bacterium]